MIPKNQVLINRIARIVTMLVRLDISPLAFALWLRYHRLEFGYAQFLSPEDGNTHQHSGGPVLAKVIRSLHIPDNSVALDLGVGMGIAALTLSRHFSSVIGVDLSPELIAIAKRNLAKMRISNVELHCADARMFANGLDRVTHVYMFNPFPGAVMSSVMENLRRSLRRVPRRLTIIYKFPVCHEAVVAEGFVHQRDIHINFSHPFAIYES